MMKTSLAVLTTGIMLALWCAHAPEANAAISAANATANCQSALPAFDDQIRKRPLAVRNEGSSNAFISCSSQTGYNATSIINGVVVLTNRTAGTVEVTCTLVDGAVAELGLVGGFYPKTVEVQASAYASIVWTPEEFERETFSQYQNYSCSLPPGIEMNVVGFQYTETMPAP